MGVVKDEVTFSSKEEELEYRMRDTPIDLRKLALARINRALEDVFDPPQTVEPLEREYALNFLTSNSKYWRETREFWCDLTDEYDGGKLRECTLAKYSTFDNKLPTDTLSNEKRIELQVSLVEYDTLCDEIKKEFVAWWLARGKVKREYDVRFSNSLLVLPFTYEHTADMNQLMRVKKEYEDFFTDSSVAYKINPITIKLQKKITSIDKLYKSGIID